MKKIEDNIILLTDSYKVTHWKQYPPGTRTVYSYFESRGGIFRKVVFFGLQYYLKRYLSGQVITQQKIDEANEYFKQHFANEQLFNKKGWERLLEKHNGYLPIKIKAVQEGSVVDVSNVLMTIENTDEEFYWLTNYLETILVQVWYGCTVATQSYHIRKMLEEYADKNGNKAGVCFKLHDFGFRGVSSIESAGVGGAAHLINFLGTDTLVALQFIKEYYNTQNIAGFSIPASEHSTITSWGRENEVEAFRNMLTQYPTGLVACVSDSYDIITACKSLWGKQLRDQVLERNGTLVIRPDSGNPVLTVIEVLNTLERAFGTYINDKGFKVLNDKVRIIQGDGVNFYSIDNILREMHKQFWSIDNIAFGMGGKLLQDLNRDTLSFAFKCSSININGVEKDVYKEPITDSFKTSKKGRLALCKSKDTYYTIKTDTSLLNHATTDLLQTVFEDGKIVKEYTFENIREKTALDSWYESEGTNA